MKQRAISPRSMLCNLALRRGRRTNVLAVLFSIAQMQAFASSEPQLRMPRFESIEKLTVGPENHFQVALGGSEERIFFTRSSNLASRLYWRGLTGGQQLGEVQPFVEAEYDTKDPSISFDGARIAFTSFENQARGDICVRNVADVKHSKAVCADERITSEQPFWLNAQTVAYIRRPIGNKKSQMVTWDLQKNEKKIVFEDQIFSAHADPRGRWIAYASVADAKESGRNNLERVLKVYRLQDAQIFPLKIALPGLSGFPRFDEPGQALYFAQFSNDTNGDARIDGNDNGVLFRIPAESLADPKGVFLPEQLTTSEQNCNYPAPGRNFLYMTCAFEGSLDVYRMPKSGLVPTQWTEKNLTDAYRTSRSTAERTLIVNTLRYRFEKYRTLESLEKVLSQHFQTGEYQAALYYLTFVEANAPAVERSGYSILRHIFEILQYRSRERLDQVSPEFVNLLEDKRKMFQAEKGAYKSFAELGLVLVDVSLRNNQRAKERFSKISLSQQRSSMEQYLYFRLAGTLLEQGVITIEQWYQSAIEVSQSPLLGEESKSFVASMLLAKVAETNKSAADRLKRVQSLQAKASVGSPLETLLRTQEFILKVAEAQSREDEDKWFQEFNRISSKTTDRYYLKRALSVQAVFTLAEFNKSRVMEYVASNWLTASKISDTEYMHARDQYVSVVLDKAYALWAKPDPTSASQVFYASVRLTDDQEAHLGFVFTLLQTESRKLLDERYQSLKSGSFTAANLDFAKAVILLFDDVTREDADSEDLLEEAENLLLGLKDDGTRPAGKHLLLGYVAHQKMLRRMKGFAFDQDLSQVAHHQYMIALDLARKSQRLTAQILGNLAMLHFQTGRFGLASGYFAAREKIAFENDEARLSFQWNFSKALYRNGEFARSVEVALQGLEAAKRMATNNERVIAWTEKAAFYLSQAGRFQESAELYKQVLGSIESRADENTIKALLMHGWTLMKSGQIKWAANAFDKLIVMADKSKARKAAGQPSDVMDFQPQRYSAMAYGFLVQMNSTPAGRIPLRANRMKIMQEWQDSLKSFSISKDNWHRFMLKDCASQAVDMWLAQDNTNATRQMDTCLARASAAVDDLGEPAHESILETLRSAWMLGSRLAEQKLKFDPATLDTYLGLSRRALSNLDAVAAASRPMANRWLRLKAERTAVQTVLLPQGHRDFQSKTDALASVQQLAGSDRIELLNADERAALSNVLGNVQKRITQQGQGK